MNEFERTKEEFSGMFRAHRATLRAVIGELSRLDAASAKRIEDNVRRRLEFVLANAEEGDGDLDAMMTKEEVDNIFKSS